MEESLFTKDPGQLGLRAKYDRLLVEDFTSLGKLRLMHLTDAAILISL